LQFFPHSGEICNNTDICSTPGQSAPLTSSGQARQRPGQARGVTPEHLRAGFGFRLRTKPGIGNYCAACFLTADPS